MSLVPIPLLDYELRFRKLTYREEFALKFSSATDSYRTILEAALVEVVRKDRPAFTINSIEDARAIMRQVPPPVLQRVWMSYRAGLPDLQVFTTQKLYLAPGVDQHQQRVHEGEAAQEAQEDPAMEALVKQFGHEAADDAVEIQRAIFADAKKRGQLQRVKSENHG